MTQGFKGEIRDVLEAPLAVAHGAERLGRALWLYLVLVLAANHRGIAIRSRDRLARELAVPEAAIDRWVDRLVDAKLIDLRSPSPFLVIQLRFWSRMQPSSAFLRGSAEAAAAASSKQIISKAGDRGQGEGEAIAAELRRVFGEADATELQPLVAGRPEAIVRQALERVNATPGWRIKKSRAALFRFLLKTLSHDPHDHASTDRSHP